MGFTTLLASSLILERVGVRFPSEFSELYELVCFNLGLNFLIRFPQQSFSVIIIKSSFFSSRTQVNEVKNYLGAPWQI